MKWRNRLAQGFSPGCGPNEIALKVATESLAYNTLLCCSYHMAQSLARLLVHSILSTKGRQPFLRSEEVRIEICGYMAGILKSLECHPIKIGGVEDHVHILSSLSKNIAFSDLIGRLKGSTSKRLKEKGVFEFGWQNGYGAFSVSESNVEAVTIYIQKQVEHHRKFTFQEEVRKLMKHHRVNFDERYVWD
jgi:putative transposase